MLKGKSWIMIALILVLVILLITTYHVRENNPSKVASPEAVASYYIKEYTLPSKHSAPLAIAVDDSGMVWYAATNNSPRIGRFNPRDGSFVEFQIPTSEKMTIIWSMVFDRRGYLWFPSVSDNSIWSFNPTTREFKKYRIPTENSFPMQVAVDGLGRIWFTELYGNKLGMIDPSTGIIREYSPPTKESGPAGIFIDKDGVVWFTQAFSGTIAKYEPHIDKFTEYKPSEKIFSPVGIVVDDDGFVWFTEHGGSLFGRFSPTNGTVIRYPTSASTIYPVTLPTWLIRDGFGRIWMNLHTGNRIAMFDPRNLVLVEYELPRGRLANILQLTLGKNGEVWFTQWSENKIAMVDTAKPKPFVVMVTPTDITIKPGEKSRIHVTVKGVSTERIYLNASSTVSYTGRLTNISAAFEPNSLYASLEGSSSVLTITAHESLQPGEYFLAVTATDQKVLYSKLIRIHVVERRGGP
jgi:virginiamycin B lyase